MSTAGIYNYRPKVDNPNETFPVQMASDSFQVPFYFGGSQVPINLHHAHGSGMKAYYKSAIDDIKEIPMAGHGLGLGLKTTSRKNDNIKLPKLMFHK